MNTLYERQIYDVIIDIDYKIKTLNCTGAILKMIECNYTLKMKLEYVN